MIVSFLSDLIKVDTLLAFISSKNDYWRNSKTPYAKAEKDYASQILNTCFNQPI